MDRDIKTASIVSLAYMAGIIAALIAGKPELAFGLVCSFMTLLTVAVFQDDENRKLRLRLKRYKRAFNEMTDKWLEEDKNE